MIITDAILDAATVAFKANGFDLRAVLEAAIGALPVVPPRPVPTVDAIARAICCPDGCRYSASHCLVGNFQHQATAVLALFGKGGA